MSGTTTINCNALNLTSLPGAVALTNSAVATVVGNINIQANNLAIGPSIVLSADGGGSAGRTGSTKNGVGLGAGPNSGAAACGGAGHGGSGGGIANIPGGVAYGSALNPTAPGSSGCASTSGTLYLGGAGGGVATVTVTTSFTMNGLISVNGLSGVNGAGGGSGGSINVQAGSLVGTGSFNANGGIGSTGSFSGGAGAGGRIAFHVQDNTFGFTGATTAFGGSMAAGAGGPGTIYIQVATFKKISNAF